jgi:hypothetical protein
MDESSDQIIEQIETQRNRLGANLNELETRVRQTTDWRLQFDRHPMLMLGAAMGGGMLLGAMVSGARSRSTERDAEPRHQPSRQAVANTRASIQRERASETVDQIKAALLAFATAKVKDFMGHALPGFDNYLREAEPRASSRSHEREAESSGGYWNTGGEYYSQQPSGSGQGANYGSDYGRPGASRRSYSPEREHASTGGSTYADL